MIRNTLTTYGSVAKFFHWTIAILIICMLVFGYLLGSVPEVYRAQLSNMHKLTGLFILSLMLLRICWSFMNLKPMLPITTPMWQRVIERIVHYSLYLAVIGMPLAGWVGSSAAGRYPHIGDMVFMLPIAQNQELVKQAFAVHGYLAIVLIVLVSIHVAAAFYHHFIKRDQILRRMLPG